MTSRRKTSPYVGRAGASLEEIMEQRERPNRHGAPRLNAGNASFLT